MKQPKEERSEKGEGLHDEIAEQQIQAWNRQFNKLQVWRSFWQELAELVQPRKAEITTKTTTPNLGREQRMFDATAIRANIVFADGCLAAMTPAGSTWFSFDPPPQFKGNDPVEQWFRLCSEIAQKELGDSNFYGEMHECHLDRGGFGTSVLFCEEGKKQTLTFKNFEIGTYALDEDDEGGVDTLRREFKMTLRQAAMKFGEKNLSAASQKLLAAEDGKNADQEIDILHCIYPRKGSDIDPTKNDGPNKPIASVYIEMKARKTVREGGYQEQPFMATRYLRWGREIYGWSPAWASLPDSRQLNFIVKQLDALAEVKAFPRMLVPDTHEEEIDVRAHGVTYYSTTGGKPEVWMDNGDYRPGVDREEKKQKAIEDSFHNDLFNMFSALDKQMTAREVAERSGEKLNQLGATFTRMTTELFNPLLQRVWGILIRAGKFPPIPEELVQQDATGNAFIPEPNISYSSRIALAIKALENTAFMRHAEGFLPLWQLRPDLMDNYAWDEITRDAARNDGFPARWLEPMDKIKQMRDARAQQQARQQQLAEQNMQADTAKAAGSIQDTSVLGKQMAAAA